MCSRIYFLMCSSLFDIVASPSPPLLGASCRCEYFLEEHVYENWHLPKTYFSGSAESVFF